jgi:hypothetical protein
MVIVEKFMINLFILILDNIKMVKGMDMELDLITKKEQSKKEFGKKMYSKVISRKKINSKLPQKTTLLDLKESYQLLKKLQVINYKRKNS